ncbi:hypothetical protein CDL12_15270 [Handroanthus impetiginosus]|uniref:DOG1 domain-containing protein n=1 Tax=Handroanthus impetiginosus TaxID=429701 RepID=A0A2G9H499_9LAMI|nr:hypothetical protein CDL12_15270 [Handroanthus impetiginosus]
MSWMTLIYRKCKRTISFAEPLAQEEIADDPLALIAKNSGEVGEWSDDLHRAMNAHSLSLAGILVEANRFRVNTLKDLIGILTPFQAVDLLVATKKLHFSIGIASLAKPFETNQVIMLGDVLRLYVYFVPVWLK